MTPAPGESTEDSASQGASPPAHHDVAVVGGGPAGASAAVFTARYGLDTAVFDSGPSSLRRCAYLTNYLGFPGGVDVETFHDLVHAHVQEAGATIHEVRVDAVERAGPGDRGEADDTAEAAEDVEAGGGADAGAPFELALHGGSTHQVDAVIAATRSGGEYLRPLDGDAMFVEHERGGEIHEHFDPEYADADGRTPIDGLYVASPAGERDVQAIVAAGQGAHVARRLLADRRRQRGSPEGLDEVYDWLRPDSEFAGERGGRDDWRAWFDSRLPEDAALDDPAVAPAADPGDEIDGATGAEADDEPATFRELREEYVDQALATRRSPEAIECLTEAGIERFVEVFDAERLLDAIDEDVVAAYLADGDGSGPEVGSGD